MGSGCSTSTEDDVWSCPAFLFFCFGCLAFPCFFPSYLSVKVFLGGEYFDSHGSLQLLTSSHLRERDKNVVKSHFVWERVERILSWQGQEGRCALPFLR